ncbi:GPN-loop GTPase 2-like protein [Leptotrombidium deliense]|uniref:GPN-loop GTPase 2 n=1 Tax=Leptotrombidium deliense TaxID=299467 RepID=A0A443SMW3_9ACAR|nr:GPN-loop GTPase 2-like protein [Leptotrombidium deliense]
MSTERKVVFGLLAIGPPGSGKTTFCNATYQHLKERGRKPVVVNLDPGNDVTLPYPCEVDITTLIKCEDAMSTLNLGPNGALLYCMEYLETNFEWLQNEMNKVVDKENDPYFIIDSPGQVELHVHHNSIKNVIKNLTSKQNPFDLRLCAVNLVDSHYCSDPGKYISALLTSLATMVHFELPHVNILSKIDLMEKSGKVMFGLDYFCDVLDLNHLLDTMDSHPFMEKYKRLSKAIAGVVEDYSLVSFAALDVNNVKTLIATMRLIDKANGFYLTNIETEEQLQRFFVDSGESDFDYAKNFEIREKLMSDDL